MLIKVLMIYLLKIKIKKILNLVTTTTKKIQTKKQLKTITSNPLQIPFHLLNHHH